MSGHINLVAVKSDNFSLRQFFKVSPSFRKISSSESWIYIGHPFNFVTGSKDGVTIISHGELVDKLINPQITAVENWLFDGAEALCAISYYTLTHETGYFYRDSTIRKVRGYNFDVGGTLEEEEEIYSRYKHEHDWMISPSLEVAYAISKRVHPMGINQLLSTMELYCIYNPESNFFNLA